MNNYKSLRGAKVEITAVASRTKVTVEVERHTQMDSFRKEPKKWIVSAWEDVEDWSTMIMNFEDGSQAVVTASDGVLGGVRNTMTIYLSNAVVLVNINPSDTVVTYAPEPHIFGDEYIAEKAGDEGRLELRQPR